MKASLKLVKTADDRQIAAFFEESVGEWHSERRYYTLPQGETKEMESIITIRFLEQGCEELEKLAQLHNLVDLQSLTCGAEVSWQSTDIIKVRRESQGLTLFGALGNLLYRDRGFATSKPVTADYYLSNPQTLCLRTEYNNSVFEEEIKLIGSKYRTRQSIISRASEQLMIGQYLEKRI
ncbi:MULTISPECIES: phycobiliprotein lyase [Aphanizomenonaceae]|uniref:Chromophore lyase CpcS/CpeS n=1 Tax=Dolichospermum heterosporum TAC447 TaxID=747523 RepID=A0ABY5LRC7_9CYAN|nr:MULTISPECIES: phycobiliprotein lyase [Aphanizomenonaceae]MBE9259873.1 phycobiliprotein lyase [Dolichospermum sp. LEGE 00246]UUO13835.1 phycobiliprotein lyase [Dolichospermum heterosporum TAC447]